MNPNARVFLPKETNSRMINLPNLSSYQRKLFQNIILEWERAPTLISLLSSWEKNKLSLLEKTKIKDDLQVLLLNINSLKTYLHELFALLEPINVPIIILNGIRHHVRTLQEFKSHFSNFQVFTQLGTNSFGGVLIAVHRSIQVRRVSSFDIHKNMIVLEIGEGIDKIQLVTTYSPARESLPINLFNDIIHRNPNSFILGDLNAKDKLWSLSTDNPKGRILFNWMEDNQFQIVNKFIPISTRSDATIDVIIIPNSSIIGSFSVLQNIGSDHLPIIWSSNIQAHVRNKLTPIKRTYWTIYELFLSFSSSYWDNLSIYMRDKVEFFCLYERFIALLAARVTTIAFNSSYKPSIPVEIINLIKVKRNLHQLVRRTKHPRFILEFKQISKLIKKSIYVHKKNCWHNYCKSLTSLDVRMFWKKMKCHYKSLSSPIDGFRINNSTVTDAEAMCAIARDFYEDQFSAHENTNSNLEREADATDVLLESDISVSSLNHYIFSFNLVKKMISKLKSKNSTGLDGVSNKMIKLIPNSHLNFITVCFNFMSELRKTPKHWKTAKIILLSKSKSTITDPNDTRPISLLSCFSKLYEKLFMIHLLNWIDINGILPEEQSGFRQGHNMSTRIISFIDQIGQGLALNTATAALFIDFKSAFNQLWVKGLWVKLKWLNCPLEILAWLRNYLTDRNAFIHIKGIDSNLFQQHKGVPQGSCIGPVLFILFHHDILNSVSNIHFKHLYADDMAVIVSPSPNWSSKSILNNLAQHIELSIENLYNYALLWKQPLNLAKTVWMVFHRQISPKIPSVNCCNSVINQVTQFKYLGVVLDSRLSFDKHISLVKGKINKNLSIFKRLAKTRMLSEDIAYRLYNAFIRSHFQSLLNLFPVLSITKQKQLEAYNRKIHRITLGWHDALNDEILNLPKYKSMTLLTKEHFNKLLVTIEHTNPSIITDYLQHKMYLVFVRDYYLNPRLRKQKQSIVTRGRTSKKVKQVLVSNKQSLMDKVFGFSN